MLKKIIGIVICCIVAAFVVHSALKQNGHEFTENQCADCHASTPVKNDRSTLTLVAPVGTLCARCHDSKNDYLSHPVDMSPAHVTLPADLPLSGEGKMTCVTCHNIHASAPSNYEGTWYYLRRDLTGRSFCASCHPGGNVTTAGQKSDHTQTMGVAHMKYTEGQGGLIDNISMACLSCHDGSLGGRDDVKVGVFSHGYDPQASHPIGVKYRRAVRSKGGLRPIGQLNKKVLLVDGMVGCASCHDPYSTEKKKLVVNNDRAQLCLECHDK